MAAHPPAARAALLLLAAPCLLLRAAAQTSPNCAINGLPCAPPLWTPTWNLTQSTVIQPGHTASYFLPAHTWGLISLDWSVARGTWFAGNNTKNTTMEATLTENCRQLKALGLASRCFIYHNTELALQWLESQRTIMHDPAFSSYFLQYLTGNPSGTPPGTIYNDPIQYGDQLFWNFSTPDAVHFYIDSLMAVVNTTHVDGAFTDDVDGLPAEHATVPAALGMSAAALAALRFDTQSMGAALIAALTLANKYTWQAFGSRDTSSPHAVARGFVGVTPATCAAFMRTYCAPAMQGRPMLMHFDATSPATANATLAAFLIVRPPIAYTGYAWESDDSRFSPLFYLQVGEPTALCAEAPAGVFQRAYTLGTPQLDCNRFSASLPFASLEAQG